jgi:hypothetical protein
MLKEEQKRRYEETLSLAREELDQLDAELATEIARAKERIQELQESKRAVKQIYDGACARLGIKGDLEVREFDVAGIVKHT